MAGGVARAGVGGLALLTLLGLGCGSGGPAGGDTSSGLDGAADADVADGSDAVEGSDAVGGLDAVDGSDTASTPDGVGPDATPITVPEEFRTASCQLFCQDAGEACGFGALGGNQAACEAACGALSAENGWWLANYACYAEGCDATDCALDGPPLGPAAGCDATCQALDQCDLLVILDLPEDQPELCRAACAGTVHADPATAALFPCIVDALDPACDTGQLSTCTNAQPTPEDQCLSYCRPYYKASAETYCDADTSLRHRWPTADACVAACVGVGTGAVALRFAGCLQAAGCGDVTPCETPPATDPPGCTDACAAMVALCGDFGGLTDTAVCAPYCTGLLLPGGLTPAADADDCIAASTCPPSDEAQAALWLQCLLPSSPDCEALCARLDSCKGSFDPGFAEADCVTACSSGYFGNTDRVTAIAACAAAEPCPSVITCIPPAPGTGDALCQPLCTHLEGDCGAPFDPQCVASCVAGFSAGAGAYAEATCRRYAACDAQSACDGVAEAAIPEPCVEACSASPLSCESSAARCRGTCAGLIAGTSIPPGDTSCVVGALGLACDTGAAVAACATSP
ncbi:MAG: hypothetical protein H6744_03170 [Deltaproteobacteria bacterium]|nr:hypothetical protein [Deltaproteobacteria bacterium]MCB9785676.1 hypothetical protein [Deltaproteobacteria bacterium]